MAHLHRQSDVDPVHVDAPGQAMLAVERVVTRASFRACDHAERAAGDAWLDGAAEAAGEELDAQKARVPRAIEACGKARWNALVSVPGATERLTPGPVASRAHHKLYEILLSCALPAPRRSVHLCEAPGGFVQATHRYVQRRSDGRDDGWSWCALSLGKGEGDYVPPTPAGAALLPMHRGRFVLADVRDAEAAAALVRAGDEGADEGADLVTADGAVEMEHGRIEVDHLELLRAQVDVALRVLRPGGALVVKCFELLRCGSAEVIAHLTHRFEQVSVIKPSSSRPTNSERYLVARGFAATPDPMPLDAAVALSQPWRVYLASVMCSLAAQQTCALRDVIACVSVPASRHS